MLIYDWPADNKLHLYGLSDQILAANLLDNKNKKKLTSTSQNNWTTLNFPSIPTKTHVNAVDLQFKQKPQVNQSLFLSPNRASAFGVDFAANTGNEKKLKVWMEKFGEWEHTTQIIKWEQDAKTIWEVQVKDPGYYQIELNYSGSGRTRLKNSIE